MADGTIGGGGRDGGAVVEVRNGLCRRERVPVTDAVPVPVPLAAVVVVVLVLLLALLGAVEGEAELEPGK